jgi:hypothetical protein
MFVDANRLIVNATGVGLSSFPSRQVLMRTLAVANSWGVPGVNWQASSDQPWLSVTPSGTTSVPLNVTANPTGLAPGQYFANVSVTSPDTGVSNQESVRVGLTVGTTDPPAVIDLPNATPYIITSPVEPIVFTATGLQGPVLAYDLNTGGLVRTLGAIGVIQYAYQLAISGDGQTLYVVNQTDGANQVSALDATSGNLLTTYNLNNPPSSDMGIVYGRPNTHPMLFMNTYAVSIDLAGYATPFNSNVILGPALRVSPDQSMLYIENTGSSPASVGAYRIVYSAIPSMPSSWITQVALNPGTDDQRSNGQDVAISSDGKSLYVASATPSQFDVLDGQSLILTSSLAATATPAATDTSWTGSVAVGVTGASSPGTDLWIYTSSGSLLGTAQSGGNSLYPRALKFSADGTRVVSAAASGLRIQSTP